MLKFIKVRVLKTRTLIILALALVLLLVWLNPYQRVIFQFSSIWNKKISAALVKWRQTCLRIVLYPLKANLRSIQKGVILQEQNGGVEMVIWNDNGSVLAGSNFESMQPLPNARRVSKCTKCDVKLHDYCFSTFRVL